MARKLTQEDVENRIKTLYDGNYRLVSSYINNKTPITVKHLTCGTEYKIMKCERFFNEGGYDCPHCRQAEIKKNPKKRGYLKLTREILDQRFKDSFRR